MISELRYNIEELTKEVGHKDSTIRELMVKIQTYEKQIESFKMTIQQLRGGWMSCGYFRTKISNLDSNFRI